MNNNDVIININGKSIKVKSHKDVRVENNKVYIDGVDVTAINGINCTNQCNIEINGNVDCVNVDCGSVTINGDIMKDVHSGNTVKCNNVHGNVTAGNTINCTAINGNAYAGNKINY
jgi:hypothetical protein